MVHSLVNIKTVWDICSAYCGGGPGEERESLLMNKRWKIPGLTPSELVSVSQL